MKKILVIISVLLTGLIINGCSSDMGVNSPQTAAPSLVAPGNGDSITSLTPMLQWNGSADKIEISEYMNMCNVMHSANTSGSTYTIPNGVLHNGTTYYWRAGHTMGGTCHWSGNVYCFTIRN